MPLSPLASWATLMLLALLVYALAWLIVYFTSSPAVRAVMRGERDELEEEPR